MIHSERGGHHEVRFGTGATASPCSQVKPELGRPEVTARLRKACSLAQGFCIVLLIMTLIVLVTACGGFSPARADGRRRRARRRGGHPLGRAAPLCRDRRGGGDQGAVRTATFDWAFFRRRARCRRRRRRDGAGAPAHRRSVTHRVHHRACGSPAARVGSLRVCDLDPAVSRRHAPLQAHRTDRESRSASTVHASSGAWHG